MDDSVSFSSLTLLFNRGSPEDLMEQLKSWHLVPRSVPCSRCGSDMVLFHSADSSDGWKYSCNNTIFPPKRKAHRCGYQRRFRKGTFFAGSQLSIEQILKISHAWIYSLPISFAMREAHVASNTAVDWASFCREVLIHAFMDNPQKIGGEGKVVEIDESKFGRRKYHRGHRVEGQWVFGGYERGTGKVFMVPVEFRGADTLLPIISEWIEPGTTIISDWWKAYDCLENEGYQHLKVNHSVNFVDPITGAHTNSIESTWRAAKASMSSSGRRKEHMAGNLARYMFLKRCKELKKDRTVEFYRLAGEMYANLDEDVEAEGGEEDEPEEEELDINENNW